MLREAPRGTPIVRGELENSTTAVRDVQTNLRTQVEAVTRAQAAQETVTSTVLGRLDDFNHHLTAQASIQDHLSQRMSVIEAWMKDQNEPSPRHWRLRPPPKPVSCLATCAPLLALTPGRCPPGGTAVEASPNLRGASAWRVDSVQHHVPIPCLVPRRSSPSTASFTDSTAQTAS